MNLCQTKLVGGSLRHVGPDGDHHFCIHAVDIVHHPGGIGIVLPVEGFLPPLSLRPIHPILNDEIERKFFLPEIFDNGDNLVAAATVFSDAGTLAPTSNAGFFADGVKLLQRPVPAGTKTLQYTNLAGLFSYVEPSSGPTNLGISAGVRSATLFSPDHGIWGYSNLPGSYGGGWTVMVDFVNWSTLTSNYPPVPGLLQGESPYFYPYNHLGPFRQVTYTQISNAPQGGAASAEFELDLRGYVSGLVLGMDWDHDVRTMSWASVTFTTSGGSIYWYTWDGFFDGYLDPNNYRATVMEWTSGNEGHLSRSLNIPVSLGQANSITNLVLDESGIPI